jgi:lipopolysaccharide/colanic/teichoic acid biosynthesis glycosyltransferase
MLRNVLFDATIDGGTVYLPFDLEQVVRVGFDDMVPLNLRHARASSTWLDLKILAQTPKAMIAGNGAC